MIYEVLVCPVCREQLAEESREESGWHYHEEWGSVEPMTISVPPSAVDQAIGNQQKEALAALQPQKESQAEMLAERAAFAALPKEERDRIKKERWDAMSPMEKTMHSMIQESMNSSLIDLNRQSFGNGGFTIPTEKS